MLLNLYCIVHSHMYGKPCVPAITVCTTHVEGSELPVSQLTIRTCHIVLNTPVIFVPGALTFI